MDSQDRVRRPRRIVVDGPLAVFADGLRRELTAQGYAVDTIGDHVLLLADLSRWLGDLGLTARELTTQRAEEFLRDRRRRGCRAGLTARAIAPLLGYLRGLRVVPPPVPPVPATREEILLADYRDHLLGERGRTSRVRDRAGTGHDTPSREICPPALRRAYASHPPRGYLGGRDSSPERQGHRSLSRRGMRGED